MLKLSLLLLFLCGQSAAAHKKAVDSSPQHPGSIPLVPPAAFTPLSARIPSDVHHGMMIDAGSGGSRLHIFRWNPRVFHEVPPPVTIPLNKETWTQRIAPGVSEFADSPKDVVPYLQNLINFAKKELENCTDNWHFFPLYFKATGGMREVPYVQREVLMTQIRDVFFNKTINPFYFQYDFARVISGEEEAAYSWSGANFLMNSLLPSSVGSGGSVSTNSTYGTLDLGGASTQIAFFLPSQDISEGLYKLQVGAQRHWNIYATSYLQFGFNSARLRFQNDLITNKIASTGSEKVEKNAATTYEKHNAITACYYSGYTENFQYKDANGTVKTYTVSGPKESTADQFDKCYASLEPLLMKSINKFCNLVYDNQCSIGGSYQPPLPDPKTHKYIGTSSYKYAWNFAQMESVGSLKEFRRKSKSICNMTFKEAILYRNSINATLYAQNGNDAYTDSQLPYYCFLSAYSLLLLQGGYGFPDDTVLQVTNTLNGHKVGWVLGAMLFEINSLPWVYVPLGIDTTEWAIAAFSVLLGLLLGGGSVYYYFWRNEKRVAQGHHHHHHEEVAEQLPLIGGQENYGMEGYQSTA